MDERESCLFCPTEFAPGAGSPEHVFLSSIGGRVVTKHAICPSCNNAFSSAQTNEADQALRSLLINACNALNIYPGRGKAPPTIERAYEASPGVFYDMAPGMVPVPRRAVIPKIEDMPVGSEHNIVAADLDDVRRVLGVLERRGTEAQVVAPSVVTHQLPSFNLPIRFNVQSAARCVAKTALVAANVLYGNDSTRLHAQGPLRAAARSSSSEMQPYVAFGFSAPWITFENLRAHPDTPAAVRSGFEHSVALADVSGRWIAFVEFFGAYRFTVDMGLGGGLPPRALILNPRASTRSLLHADVVAPLSYAHPSQSLPDQGQACASDLQQATQRALDDCYRSGRTEKAEALMEELLGMLAAAGDDRSSREGAFASWAKKLATLESGEQWHEPIDLFVG